MPIHPDALLSILRTLRTQAPKRIICAVGCGGDRGSFKAVHHGEIAATMSDLAIITSDNPRSEDPRMIVDDVLKGIDTSLCKELTLEQLNSQTGFYVEPDRRTALEIGVRASNPGDIIVAAGKGHETYQVIKTGTIDFDDRKILRKALADMQTPGEKS